MTSSFLSLPQWWLCSVIATNSGVTAELLLIVSIDLAHDLLCELVNPARGSLTIANLDLLFLPICSPVLSASPFLGPPSPDLFSVFLPAALQLCVNFLKLRQVLHSARTGADTQTRPELSDICDLSGRMYYRGSIPRSFLRIIGSHLLQT